MSLYGEALAPGQVPVMEPGMNERSAGGLFIAKAEQAEERAAKAQNEKERATWLDIAKEYRKLAEEASGNSGPSRRG